MAVNNYKYCNSTKCFPRPEWYKQKDVIKICLDLWAFDRIEASAIARLIFLLPSDPWTPSDFPSDSFASASRQIKLSVCGMLWLY